MLQSSAQPLTVLESGDTVVLSSLTILSTVTVGSIGRGQNFRFRFRKFESYGKNKTKKQKNHTHNKLLTYLLYILPFICHQNLYIVEVKM